MPAPFRQGGLCGRLIAAPTDRREHLHITVRLYRDAGLRADEGIGPYDRRVWLPLEGKLSQPIPREAATDEVEPAAFDGP